MRSQFRLPRLRVPLGLRAGIVMGVALALVGVVVGTATGAAQVFQQVLVVNPASSPVPVVGTVTVGNPASSPVPVAGTVTIGNTSIPVTQSGAWTVQGGDTTTVIASGTLDIHGVDQADIVTDYDFTPFKEVQIYVEVFNVAIASEFVIDSAASPNPLQLDGGKFTAFKLAKTYGLLPAHTSIALTNLDGGTATYVFVVLGRTN